MIRQKDLRFQPRVQVLPLGGKLQFSNNDQEAHNVHILGAGIAFNQTMKPGEQVEFTPKTAGLLKILCDIHIHMRAFVWVGATPWFTLTAPDGSFRLTGVPAGRYRLKVWHSLGRPVEKAIEVSGDRVDLGRWELQAELPNSKPGATVAPEPWPAVIDRVSLACAAALETASRRDAGAQNKAVSQVDDAYLGIFEASEMEVAVGALLGYDRVIEIESQFRLLRREARGVADGASTPARMSASIRRLLATLVQAARDLQSKGVGDRSQLNPISGAARATAGAGSTLETKPALFRLRSALNRVAALVEKRQTQAAATELVTVYFEAFEPIERVLAATNPGAVRPLETRFAILRGQIEGGLSGGALETALSNLYGDVELAVGTSPTGDSAAFGVSLLASLGTILREGVEILLILGVLGAVIAKAGSPRGARRALWSGVGLAALASALTAIGLNQLIGTARNQTRELIEGGVMLAASGILFYVSYWLIAQSESQRWIAFLKSAAARGASSSKFFALGLAAFLAVYREGAEVILMYQGLFNTPSRAGTAGVFFGLFAGLVLLVLLAWVVRATSLRLPLKTFFRVTGILLFTLALVFAGHGVLELQTAHILRATEVPWLGRGVPVLGLHPTLQGLIIQGIILAGALLACTMYVATLLRGAGRLQSGTHTRATPPKTLRATQTDPQMASPLAGGP